MREPDGDCQGPAIAEGHSRMTPNPATIPLPVY
jgi:hypothetical protein